MINKNIIQNMKYSLKILILLAFIILMFYKAVLNIQYYFNPDPRNLLDMNKYVIWFCIFYCMLGIILSLILYRIIRRHAKNR